LKLINLRLLPGYAAHRQCAAFGINHLPELNSCYSAGTDCQTGYRFRPVCDAASNNLIELLLNRTSGLVIDGFATPELCIRLLHAFVASLIAGPVWWRSPYRDYFYPCSIYRSPSSAGWYGQGRPHLSQVQVTSCLGAAGSLGSASWLVMLALAFT